ncbi:MAG: hypothetical protein OEM41_03030 [Ignavibacteria bacterium]|nr:hypothetical protein [Ignavibacteria bacterium]
MHGTHHQTVILERAEDSGSTGCAEVQELTEILDAVRIVKIQANEAVNFLGLETGGLSDKFVSSST